MSLAMPRTTSLSGYSANIGLPSYSSLSHSSSIYPFISLILWGYSSLRYFLSLSFSRSPSSIPAGSRSPDSPCLILYIFPLFIKSLISLFWDSKDKYLNSSLIQISLSAPLLSIYANREIHVKYSYTTYLQMKCLRFLPLKLYHHPVKRTLTCLLTLKEEWL